MKNLTKKELLKEYGELKNMIEGEECFGVSDLRRLAYRN